MSKIKQIKPVNSLNEVMQVDNMQIISRGLKYSVVAEGTISNCFATDVGGSSAEADYAAPDTTGSAVFERCTIQNVGDDFKNEFNLSLKSAVTILASFGLYADSYTEVYAHAALYVDEVKIEPTVTTISAVSEGTTLHYSSVLTKGSHSAEIRYYIDGGPESGFYAYLTNPRISVFSQQLIHK